MLIIKDNDNLPHFIQSINNDLPGFKLFAMKIDHSYFLKNKIPKGILNYFKWKKILKNIHLDIYKYCQLSTYYYLINNNNDIVVYDSTVDYFFYCNRDFTKGKQL